MGDTRALKAAKPPMCAIAKPILNSPPWPVTNIGTVAGTSTGAQWRDKMENPIAYTVVEACAVARAGRTSLYDAIKRGELIARKRGRKTLIIADDLRRWVEALPAIELKP